MTKILRTLFKFESEYSGSPLYVPGNSFRHALSLQLNTSIGIFTNVIKLSHPHTYQEFFKIRTAKCFLHPYVELWWDKSQQRRSQRWFFLPQYVTFDIINPPDNLIEMIEKKSLIQLGGKRNIGFGIVTFQDAVEIDFATLPLPEKASHLTLISPAIYLPPTVELYNCRHKQVKLWNHNKINRARAVAPGQFFRIKGGKSIPKVAKRGILHKGPLGQFGFGEYIVHDWNKN